MAESKPPDIPRWADTGVRVEPGEAKKDDGWVAPEKPPDTFFNWLMGTTGDWFKWLNERLFDDTEGSGTAEQGVVLSDPQTTEPNGPTRGVTKLRIVDPVAGSVRIAAIAITNNIGGGSQIEATGALFVTGLVEVNDLIELVGTNANDGFYLVSGIVDEDNVTAVRLDGAAAAFGAEAGIQGTVKLYERQDIQGHLIAPGGWNLQPRNGGFATVLESGAVGADLPWVYPGAVPTGVRALTYDAAGQVAFGAALQRRVQIGDGVTTFGDFNGTDHAPFVSAIADVDTNGGFIEVLPGTYTFEAQVNFPATGNKILMVGLGDQGVTGPGAIGLPILAHDGVIASMFGEVGESDVEFRNLHFQHLNASTEDLLDIGGATTNSVWVFRNCRLEGNSTTQRLQLITEGGTGGNPVVRLIECQLDKVTCLFGDVVAEGRGELIRCTGTLTALEIQGSDCLIDACDLVNDSEVVAIGDVVNHPPTERCRIYRSALTVTGIGSVLSATTESGAANAQGHHDLQGNWFRSTRDSGGDPNLILVVWGASFSRLIGNRFTYENAVAANLRYGLQLFPTGNFDSTVRGNTIHGNHFDAALTGGSTGGAVFIEAQSVSTFTPKRVTDNSLVGNTLGRDLRTSTLATMWQLQASATVGNVANVEGNTLVGNQFGGGISLVEPGSGGTEAVVNNVIQANALNTAGSGFTHTGVADDNNSTRMARINTFVSSTTPGFTARPVIDLDANQSADYT